MLRTPAPSKPFSASSAISIGFYPSSSSSARTAVAQIQVREASRICGMSESHFMSFFKRVTGLSFMKYLNHYRVERSQVLLVNTDEPMANISQEMGFCDQSYFGTVFRRLVGMTPAAYRRRFRTKDGATGARNTPPAWPAKATLTGAPRAGGKDTNRQLPALHDKPTVRPTYFQ